MELNQIKYLRLQKELFEAESKLNFDENLSETFVQLDEISNYNLVVTYYRHLGLDPYKLRGVVGSKLRAQIKQSPGFHAWLKANHYENVSVEDKPTLIETLKSAKNSKKVQVTFFGYPDKNSKPSDTVQDETGTNFNYLTPN